MVIEIIIRSILLGVGLAMDAFSVSLANGLNEYDMKRRRALAIAGTFALFQFVMPMAGWIIVHTAVEKFSRLEAFIPWLALILLLMIGGGMLTDGIKARREQTSTDTMPAAGGDGTQRKRLSAWGLFVQGVATSIDALSVGFTIEQYSLDVAIMSSAIIGTVTLLICLGGLDIGRRIGTRLSGRASILGGLILIAIGIEIWAKGVIF